MVFGPKFKAFRIVLLITIVVTIIVILIDPSGTRTRAIEQGSSGGSPWIGRWFSLAVLFLLYFICLTGRGHLAWITFVFVVLITAYIVICFNFIIPQINAAQNPTATLESQLLLDCDGDADIDADDFVPARKFVVPVYY